MRQFLFVFISLGFLFSCIHDKEKNESTVLTLPFGKYYNWTNWEMKEMNFRIQDNEILIDTTYNLNPQDFKTHHLERLEDYSEIAKFLKKPKTELHELQSAMSKISCDNRHQFWIKFTDGAKLDLIKFNGTIDCDTTQDGTLSLVYQEMEKLKDKYSIK
jgi:hypothetical protein